MLPGNHPLARSRPPALLLALTLLGALLGALLLSPALTTPATAGPSAAARAASADQAADRLVVAVNRGKAAVARKVAAPAVVAEMMRHRRAGLRFGGREVNPCTGKGTRRSCTALVYRGGAVRGYLQATATRGGSGWTITRATVTLF